MRIKLNPALAERFIKQIAQYTEYNVNIMGETGHIIASSRNPERVGTFHEVAYQLIREHQEMMIIDDTSGYFGVKSGVNLLLSSGKQILGVVGVTGEPEKVKEIALIIKMALETMIAYEEQQYVNLYQKSKYEQMYLALFDEKVISREKLEILAEQLKFDSKCVRIPIVFVFSEEEKMDNVMAVLKGNFLVEQDMCWLQNNHHILIYKKMAGEKEELFSSWRENLEDWLNSINEKISYIQAFVGTLQCRLSYYSKGLQHCQWLEKQVHEKKKNIFFTDYIGNYLDSLIPEIELHAIYNVYDRFLENEFKSNFAAIIGSLRESNYNLVTSSKKMFIHKNTLAFRMNKIKTVFNANPFCSGKERSFLEGFYRYLKQKPS